MAIKIYPWKAGSNGAKALATALGGKVLRRDTTYQQRLRDDVINWGSSSIPNGVASMSVLNFPDAVRVASCKLATFNKLKESQVSIPEFTTDINVAKQWRASDPSTIVVCRSVLNGNSGAGITVCEGGENLVAIPNVKLYVKYIKKKTEFRVHVLDGVVFDVQEKRKRSGADANSRIQNLANGYVFCRGDIYQDAARDELAVKAVNSLGLDFGAVDMIYNSRLGKYFVLEVNTAPGLEGTTLERYAKAFKEYLGGDDVTPLCLTASPEQEQAAARARQDREEHERRTLIASNRSLSQIQELIPLLNNADRLALFTTLSVS